MKARNNDETRKPTSEFGGKPSNRSGQLNRNKRTKKRWRHNRETSLKQKSSRKARPKSKPARWQWSTPPPIGPLSAFFFVCFFFWGKATRRQVGRATPRRCRCRDQRLIKNDRHVPWMARTASIKHINAETGDSLIHKQLRLSNDRCRSFFFVAFLFFFACWWSQFKRNALLCFRKSRRFP